MENRRRNCEECDWPDGMCDCDVEPPVRSSELVRRLWLWCQMVKGYYHPTRRAGHGRLASIRNGIRLANQWWKEPPNARVSDGANH